MKNGEDLKSKYIFQCKQCALSCHEHRYLIIVDILHIMHVTLIVWLLGQLQQGKRSFDRKIPFI